MFSHHSMYILFNARPHCFRLIPSHLVLVPASPHLASFRLDPSRPRPHLRPPSPSRAQLHAAQSKLTALSAAHEQTLDELHAARERCVELAHECASIEVIQVGKTAVGYSGGVREMNIFCSQILSHENPVGPKSMVN